MFHLLSYFSLKGFLHIFCMFKCKQLNELYHSRLNKLTSQNHKITLLLPLIFQSHLAFALWIALDVVVVVKPYAIGLI